MVRFETLEVGTRRLVRGPKPAPIAGWRKVYTLFVLLTAATTALSAQTLTTLATFNGPNGSNPYLANLVQGTDGNFYGVTQFGGANNNVLCGNSGCGTIFEITASGQLTTLYNFCSLGKCADGALPTGTLVQVANGNFYGTTNNGGPKNFGTVFEITPAGVLTTLYNFCSLAACADGAVPVAGLVRATDGNFYGTTLRGGAHNQGSVFKITAAGKLTTLYSFYQGNGEFPVGALIQATDGNLYGTTSQGGFGTIFRITTAGVFTRLHLFSMSEGMNPDTALVQASDGNLYGTAFYGGTGGRGTVFKFGIHPLTGLTVLHSFDETDGSYPNGPLVQATDGKLYGTTYAGGGPIDFGTIFAITTSGSLTSLYNFCSLPNCADGELPAAGLIQGTDGTLYGTTTLTEAGVVGTVFGFSVGLNPFVETRPTSGFHGTTVTILGNNLTGATSVTFNGAAATFTVVSSTEINTTVPLGATTGFVKVTTPGGTLKSNVIFRVTQ
jgi:uncharacterized repeat protein (TIGR03803 family)